MVGRSPFDRMRAAGLAVRRLRRSALGQLDRLHVLRWLHGTWNAEELSIVPPDLRTGDASFAFELAAGELGLAGAVVGLHGTSPFRVVPPSPAWLEALYGFGWLRHLAAAAIAAPSEAERDAVRADARALFADWLALGRAQPDAASEPAVIARRVLSVIAHAGLLLEGASEAEHDRYAAGLAADVRSLQMGWSEARPAAARLLSLIALVEAALCIEGHERQLVRAERRLVAELDRQILADGGHVSRDAGVLVELILDMLPLRRCYLVLARPFPEGLARAIDRMLAMLRRMRLGDGSLARFNGVGSIAADALATIFAYDESPAPIEARPGPSGYARLERGSVVVIADVGRAPPLEHSGRAHAGTLSFEMSDASHALIVNRGAPSAIAAELGNVARATASHSTAVVGGVSSARLLRDSQIVAEIGAEPIVGPGEVTSQVRDDTIGDAVIEASHDGYRSAAGIEHRRRLQLAGDGCRLDGVDTLLPARGGRGGQPLDVALHFHLSPEVVARSGEGGEGLLLEAAGGNAWLFEAHAGTVALEVGSFLATVTRPQPSLAIVVRLAQPAPVEVRWSLRRRDGPTTSRRHR
jgi:uncharacterized heparinase superfamily protein